MPHYFVNRNAQANGDHEVHRQGCHYMPDPANCDYVGQFPSCREAVQKARTAYPRADGCYWCCREAHRS